MQMKVYHKGDARACRFMKIPSWGDEDAFVKR